MIIGWINDIVQGFADIVIGILEILPDTPFNWSLADGMGIMGQLMTHVNYFIPFATILSIMMTYVTAVAIWYAIRWLLRFVQFIQ